MSKGRIWTTTAIVAAVTQLMVSGASRTAASEPVTVAYAYTGAAQTFQVPASVTSIHVVMVGGSGATTLDAAGGFGARVEADLAVVAGQTLSVVVGGNGEVRSGGFNGGGDGGGGGEFGGGGGGASDLRLGTAMDSRILVAAGGGGGGSGAGVGAGAGGDAGSPGENSPEDSATGGGEGSQSSGGAGGVYSGMPGGPGTGGAGGAESGSGGGGGGGYFGGGGGGANISFGAGGGGGSNYTGTATDTSVSTDTTGTPSITITYLGPSGSGTVSAAVSVPSSAACLELSTGTVDFGTLPLGVTGAAATPDVTVTNCSGISETILARGTDATATGAAWSLTDVQATCADTLGLDSYRMGLQSGTAPAVQLSTTNKSLHTLDATATAAHTALIDTACPGSTGGGATMTMQIVFVATE